MLEALGEQTGIEPPPEPNFFQVRANQSLQPKRILFILLSKKCRQRKPVQWREGVQVLIHENMDNGLADHLPFLIFENRGGSRVGFENMFGSLGPSDARGQ